MRAARAYRCTVTFERHRLVEYEDGARRGRGWVDGPRLHSLRRSERRSVHQLPQPLGERFNKLARVALATHPHARREGLVPVSTASAGRAHRARTRGPRRARKKEEAYPAQPRALVNCLRARLSVAFARPWPSCREHDASSGGDAMSSRRSAASHVESVVLPTESNSSRHACSSRGISGCVRPPNAIA